MAAGKLELKELYKHVPEKEVIQNMGIVELMVEQKKEEARIEARIEAREEGIEEGRADVAKTMLIKGLALSDISEFTGLPEAELSKLKSEVDKD